MKKRPKKERLSAGLLYTISDRAHFFFATTIVLTANLISLRVSFCAAIVAVALASWKEFIYDPKHETRTVAGPTGWRDWTGYVLGLAAALGLALFKWRFS